MSVSVSVRARTRDTLQCCTVAPVDAGASKLKLGELAPLDILGNRCTFREQLEPQLGGWVGGWGGCDAQEMV